MKINQVGNFSRVKELINQKGDMGERVEAIVAYLNLNNKILKSYEKTRKYYDVKPESYIISRELPEKIKRKRGDEPETPQDEPVADPSAWNPASPKYSPHSPEFVPHSPDGPPPTSPDYMPHTHPMDHPEIT